MRKTIRIGNKDVDLECNAGTGKLFQDLTGRNIYEINSEVVVNSKELIQLQRVRPDKEEDPEAYSNYLKQVSEHMDQITQNANKTAEIGMQLAYIMNMQATHGHDRNSIEQLRALMNETDLLVWQMEFDSGDFNTSTFTTVMSLWNAQKESSSVSKN